jgi:hypothetical protein
MINLTNYDCLLLDHMLEELFVAMKKRPTTNKKLFERLFFGFANEDFQQLKNLHEKIKNEIS